MRLAAVLACACSSPPKQTGYPDIAVEQDPPRDAGEAGPTEPLPYQPLEAHEQPVRERFKSGGVPAASIPAAACIPAGTYRVTVDLSTATLSQVKTGMPDLTWCKSLLEAVPRASMATLKIEVANARMTVEWPPGKPSTIAPTGACSFAVTSPPMIATITFANGKGTGATSYQVGTQNHPEESCSAIGAKLALDPAT